MFENFDNGKEIRNVNLKDSNDPKCFVDVALIELKAPFDFEPRKIESAWFYDDSQIRRNFENLLGSYFFNLNHN